MDANESAKVTPVARRPRRRWLQYSLRSLFALMTLVACGLGYLAYPYRQECEVANQILKLDPHAEITWESPEWVRQRGLPNWMSIFDRIVAVRLRPDGGHVIEDDAIESLELSRLHSLHYFDAYSYLVSDEAEDYVRQGFSHFGVASIPQRPVPEAIPAFTMFPIGSLSMSARRTELLLVGGNLNAGFTRTMQGLNEDSSIQDEPPNPSVAFEGTFLRTNNFICDIMPMLTLHWMADRLDDKGRIVAIGHPVFVALPDLYSLHGYGSYKEVDTYKENVTGIKTIFWFDAGTDPVRRLFAARALWHGKSRECAKQIFDYARALEPKNDDERAFKELVARDTSPERILSGLRGIRHAFSAWLAALEPRPEYVPELIRAVEEGRAANETLYALEHSTNDRAVRFLKSRQK